MNKVKPKKALGQHFLTDETIAARIAATLDDYKGMPVLEVAPEWVSSPSIFWTTDTM